MKVTLTNDKGTLTEEFATPEEAIRFIDTVSKIYDLLAGRSKAEAKKILESAQHRVQPTGGTRPHKSLAQKKIAKTSNKSRAATSG